MSNDNRYRRNTSQSANIGLLAALLTVGLGLNSVFPADTGLPEPTDKTRANILFIPLDDLKPLLGCYGDKTIKTPNIDRLAAHGTIFRNNMCQQAICGPTRASLMTGMYPDHTRVWDLNTRMRDVDPDILSLPQYFRQQGYETTGIGKTFDGRCVGGGHDAPSWSIPYGSGFRHEKERISPATGAKKGGKPQASAKQAARGGVRGLEKKKDERGDVGPAKYRPATVCADVPDNQYMDGQFAERGCELIEQLSAAEKPFFLSVGFLKPHLPFIAPKKYWDLYDREKLPLAPFQQRAANSPAVAYHNSQELRWQYSDIPDVGPLTPELQKELIHGYHACVSYVDAQVGKLLDKLDELGIADNTIICLWGDHGWHLGDHGLWCKHTNFEQATRAPLIIAAPGMPGGVTTDAPTGFIDVFPTLCDLAGLPIPGQLQGRSLVPLMTDPAGSVREAVLSQYPRNMGRLPVMGYTLRSNRYRYVKWLQMDYRKGERTGLLVATELYDYEKDPLETVSQAGNPEYRAIVDRFETLFKEMNVAQHTGLHQ